MTDKERATALARIIHLWMRYQAALALRGVPLVGDARVPS